MPRRRPATLSALALAGLTSLGGGGCAYFSDTPVLAPATGEVVLTQDVPVPEGFELREDDTLRHERTAYRRLRLSYRRPDYLSQERVLEFVRQVYPAHGWKVEFVTGLETAKVILTKGSEECRVTVSEDFGDAFTDMLVEVEPRTTPQGGLVARSGWTATADEALPAPPAASTASTASGTIDETIATPVAGGEGSK